jgi:dinuclear metal center YbgI/SA1388 family protein
MPTVNDVYKYLCTFAPESMKMDFDNVGFLVGRANADASKILISLDITSGVITEALDIGAGLIVSHHPLFFSLKSVTDADITGGKVVRLLSGGISAICMHTNLDAALGGVNDALAAAAGIASCASAAGIDYCTPAAGITAAGEAELLAEDGCLPDGTVFSYGRAGRLKTPCPLSEYLDTLKKALGTSGLRYYDAGRDVYKVAVVGGSGGGELHHAVSCGCDTFVTADIKYDVFLDAKELGINLIDGDHFCTENLITRVLADKLRTAFPEASVVVSKCHGQTVRFF